MSDTVANLKLTMGQRQRNKSIQKDGFHCPDLIIFEPNEKYCGLFIELKKETPYKKDGTIKMQKTTKKIKGIDIEYNHLQAQQDTMDILKTKGYYCTFSWSVNQSIEIIEKYLNNKL
jgi:hypothetical protein